MTLHLLQPMPLAGDVTVSATARLVTSVPTYLGSWQVCTVAQPVVTAQPAVATPVITDVNAAARTAATANKRHQATAAQVMTHQATKAFAKATGNTTGTNPISTNPISTKALPATQGTSPRRSPA